MKFVCANFGTLLECRPERGWNEEHSRPDDCRSSCIYHEDFIKRYEEHTTMTHIDTSLATYNELESLHHNGLDFMWTHEDDITAPNWLLDNVALACHIIHEELNYRDICIKRYQHIHDASAPRELAYID